MNKQNQYRIAVCCFLLLFVDIGMTATSALFYSEWSSLLSIPMSKISLIPTIVITIRKRETSKPAEIILTPRDGRI